MPHITRALNVEAIPADWQHRLEEADCAGLHFAKEFFDAAQVRAIRDAGYHMLVFTVNDADTAQRLLQAGVDGVFTDMPQQLQQTLKGARAGSFNH
jgi:glycerophosphoryl diester phosphodiesterase